MTPTSLSQHSQLWVIQRGNDHVVPRLDGRPFPMSKALGVLKLFFSLVSINSTEPLLTRNISERNQSAPQVANPLDRSIVYIGQAFRIPIPENTFYDAEDGNTKKLTLVMTTSHGEAIPPNSWIRFDSKKLQVYGFPLPGNAITFNYSLIARDQQGSEAKADIIVHVKETNYSCNHEVLLKTSLSFQQYMTKVNLRVDLVTRLARYVVNKAPRVVWVKSFDKDTMRLTIVFTNLKYWPCDKKAIENIKKKMKGNSGVSSKLIAELTAPPWKFDINAVEIKLLGPCDPNLDDRSTPFEWGWLKHVLPVLILLGVVGIPVTISILVSKFRFKPASARDGRKRPESLRRKKEDDTSFNFHTVHFNNRYPSILSVSNNSKEETTTDEEKNVGVNGNFPNASRPCRHTTIPNGTTKNPAVPNTGPLNLNHNTATKPQNTKKPIRSMREIMYEDEDDDLTNKTELNIPVFYNIRKGAEEKTSTTDNVMDVNFAELAENISSKLKDIGKSVLNLAPNQDEPTEYETANEASTLSSKLKDIGMSVLNIPADKANYEKTEESISASPSISSKLVDFTKSMLNVSHSQSETQSNTFENGSSTLTKLRDFGKSMLNLTTGQGSHFNDSTTEEWETPEDFDNDVPQFYGLKDIRGDWSYETPESEVPLYDIPSHGDDTCYNFYDVARDTLEYSAYAEGFPSVPEVPPTQYGNCEYQDVDMNELYRKKEAEASKFMINFQKDTPMTLNDWELGDSHSDKMIYDEYVNPYHYGNGMKGSHLQADHSSSEFYWQDEYEKEKEYKSQRECFSSMPDLFEKHEQHRRRSYPQKVGAQAGERGSLLGSLFSPKHQENEENSSVTSFIKTQVKGFLGKSEGNVSKWLFQESDGPFT